jgi:hypothetical protein
MQTQTGWTTGADAWSAFVERHPELGYKSGRMSFHNFLRNTRSQLLDKDAIRLAKNKFWIAHTDRFCSVAFDCATGKIVRSSANTQDSREVQS